MANPIFIRTGEGVLLRFEDASVARRWIESGRLQWSDRFLGTDQAWHPLTDLLDFSQAGGAPAVTSPAFSTATAPGEGSPRMETRTSAAGPEDLRRTAEWVQPPEMVATPRTIATVPETHAAEAVPAVPTPPATPVVRDAPMEGPTRSKGEAARPSDAAEEDWWASDPKGSSAFLARRAVRLAVILVLGVAAGVGIWLLAWSGPEDSVGTAVTADLSMARGVEDAGGMAENLGRDAGLVEAVTRPGGEEGADRDRESQAVTADPGIGGPGPEPGGALPAPSTAGPEDRQPVGAPRAGVPPASEEADTYDAHMEAGNRLMSTRPDAAMAHFRRAAQLRPNRVEPFSRMGDLALQQQDLAGAERHYREAIRRNADYGPTILGMARLKQRLGDREDARYWYTRYLERFPQGSGASEARTYLDSF